MVERVTAMNHMDLRGAQALFAKWHQGFNCRHCSTCTPPVQGDDNLPTFTTGVHAIYFQDWGDLGLNVGNRGEYGISGTNEGHAVGENIGG